MEQKFYICKHCGNIIAKVKDAGVPVVCCGEKMSEIIPNTTDAAVEKHLPVWTVENGVVHVKVSTVAHPMLPEHYIEWVSIHTKQGNQRKELHPGDAPEICFALCEGDEVESVYAYCNLHGLWAAPLRDGSPPPFRCARQLSAAIYPCHSVKFPLSSVFGTSIMRWLLEPRNRREISYSACTKRPSTSTSSRDSSSSVTSQQG